MSDAAYDRQPWHLDRRVPVALILAIAVQTASAIWWAASQNARVTALEEWRADSKGVAADIATIRANIQAIQGDIQDVKDRLRDGKIDYNMREQFHEQQR